MIESALIEGIMQGGVAGVTAWMMLKYIVARLDRQFELLVRIDTHTTPRKGLGVTSQERS